MTIHLVIILFTATGFCGFARSETPPRFVCEREPLVMGPHSLRDANGSFTLSQLPSPEPRCKAALIGTATPLTQRMWAIALDDVERNLVTNEAGTVYFGAGTRYGDRVYTRETIQRLPQILLPRSFRCLELIRLEN